MTNELKNTIKEELSKLPQDAQDAINSIDWIKIIEKLCESITSNENVINSIETETFLVLLGMQKPESLRINLKIQSGLTEEESVVMSEEILEQIFIPILEKKPNTLYKTEEVSENLDERFDKLPKEIRQIIIDIDYHSNLYAIAQENKLNVAQMGRLEEVTTNMIIDSIHPDQFDNILRENLDLDIETTNKLVSSIKERILLPIRTRMEETYGKTKNPYEIKPAQGINPARTNEFLQGNPIVSGIKINKIPNKPNLNLLELKKGDPSVDKPMNPVFAKKLSQVTQTKTTKTDYTLNNVTKNTPTPDKYTIDPYRIAPDN